MFRMQGLLATTLSIDVECTIIYRVSQKTYAIARGKIPHVKLRIFFLTT